MSATITAVLVDDEDYGRTNLRSLIQKRYSEITVIGEASSVRELNKVLARIHPDVVFLDIRMPGSSGLDFLECVPSRDFEVILVTAFNKYGLRALKTGVLDYILKPIDPDEMDIAIQKLKTQLEQKEKLNRVSSVGIDQIHVPHAKGVSLIDPNQIIRIKADNNYVTLFFVKENPLTVAKTIKEFTIKLKPFGFFRAHKSHLINLKHIQSYSRLDGGEIRMLDGETINLAKRRASEFHQLIKHNSILIQ